MTCEKTNFHISNTADFMKALNVLMKKPAWLGKSGYISAKFGKDELLRRITVRLLTRHAGVRG